MTASVISAAILNTDSPNPSSPIAVDIDSECTALYVVWSAGPNFPTTLTLDGNAPDQTETYDDNPFDESVKLAAWYNPATGSGKNLAFSGQSAANWGPGVSVFQVKGGDTSSWRGTPNVGENSSDPSGDAGGTVTTVVGDLVLAAIEADSSQPATPSGFTSIDDAAGEQATRLVYKVATGTSEDAGYTGGYPSWAIWVIPPSAAAATIAQTAAQPFNDDGTES